MKLIITEDQFKRIINPQESTQPIVVAVGDSITAGNGSYIDMLGGGKYAKGGKASFQLMGELTNALQEDPDYVIIFVGINNPHSGQGCSAGWEEKLISDLEKMYSYTRAAGAEVIGITLVPAIKHWGGHYRRCKKYGKGGKLVTNGFLEYCCNNNELRNPFNIGEGIKKVNDWIRTHADIVIDAAGEMSDENGIIDSYDHDGIHLNGNAHQWITNEITYNIE